MDRLARTIAAALLLVAVALPHGVRAEGDVAVRTGLQAEMQRYLDRNLVEGALVDLDMESGELRHLYPTKSHPVILQGEGYYVLCVDLSTESGEETFPADLYMVEDGRGYRVIRTEIDNRPPLHALVSSGKISKF